MLSRILHSSIAIYFESFSHVNYFYIVTEFINGKPLDECIPENRKYFLFDEGRVARFLVQVVSALKYCKDPN
jgi:serine/threonine protein kinase